MEDVESLSSSGQRQYNDQDKTLSKQRQGSLLHALSFLHVFTGINKLFYKDGNNRSANFCIFSK